MNGSALLFSSSLITKIRTRTRIAPSARLTLPAIILASVVYSFSQPPRASRDTPPARIVPAQSLDLSKGVLPSDLTLINPAELYDVARRSLIASEKGEFETTPQYQQRIDDLTQKPLFHGLKAGDEFAFVLRPISRSLTGSPQKGDDFLTTGFLETSYDADSNQMSVSIPIRAGESPSDYKWVSLMRRSVSYGPSYVGQNAFSVQRVVRRVKADTLEIEVENHNWFSPAFKNDDFNLAFCLSVDPDAARQLSRDIEVILIGKLLAPFTSRSVEGVEPSLDQVAGPTQITYVHRMLHISLDQLIIANDRTGVIIKSFCR